MRHQKCILVLLVVLAFLGASQSITICCGRASAAAGSGPLPVIANGTLHPFRIDIGPFGYKDTSERYTVKAGKYIIAHLETSGGHDVYMTVIRSGDQRLAGGNSDRVRFTREGQTKILWTNVTSTTEEVTIRMSSPTLAPVHAAGVVSTGWYTAKDTIIY